MKGNQPSLLRQLRSLPWQHVPLGHVQDGRGHGRIEKRIVKVVTVAAGLVFPHAETSGGPNRSWTIAFIKVTSCRYALSWHRR